MTNTSRKLTFPLLFLLACAGPGRAADSPAPFELRPYRVRVLLSFPADARFPPSLRRRVRQTIAHACERSMGRMWDVRVAESPEAFRRADLQELPVQAATGRWSMQSLIDTSAAQRDVIRAVQRGASHYGLAPGSLVRWKLLAASAADGFVRFAESFDTLYLVSVEPVGSRYRVAARSWESSIRDFGPLKTGTSYEPQTLGEDVFLLIAGMFQPLLSVQSVEEETVHLRLRAGEFPAPDEQFRQLVEGDFLEPLFRYRDRQHLVQRIQTVPWTYLLVDEVERGRVTCTMISGLNMALGTGRGRRLEILARRLRPSRDATRLQLTLRQNPANRLAGHYVDVVPKRFARDDAEDEPQRLLTDRRGRVSIPVHDEHPLVWLYVRSGEALLARVPFVPGVEAHTSIELPDDSLRLAAEGEIELLKSRLLDTLAQRTLLIARATRAAKQSDWLIGFKRETFPADNDGEKAWQKQKRDAQLQLVTRWYRQLSGRTPSAETLQFLTKKLPERLNTGDELLLILNHLLQQLPDEDRFREELTAIQESAIRVARERNNRVAQARIRRLAADAEKLVQRYLAVDKLRQAKEEITELLQLEIADAK